MSLFVILRQAGPVHLQAGLNSGLCKQWQGFTTTTRAIYPTLCEKHVGSLMPPANQYSKDVGYGVSVQFISLFFEKTKMYNHLLLS